MNSVVLIGRLARDPELSYTPNTQTAVCKFTLAVDRPRRQGEDQGADFLRITVFGASHAPELGVRITGLPAGLSVGTDALQSFLNRRMPGGGAGRTARREPDRILFREGLADGKTTAVATGE